jgi:hypothetical protein
MAALLEEVLNVQLIQELRQQRNKLNRQGEGRLLDLVRPGIYGGANQEIDEMAAGQSPAQGYSPAPEYEDWQSRTQPPQDSRPPQDSQYPQDLRYPQDSTAFGRPQQDAQGQQGTRGQGR